MIKMNSLNNLIICTSSFLRETSHTRQIAEDLFNALDRLGVRHMELSNTNDYWCRDYMPVCIFPDGYYANYMYRPDYLWDTKSNRKYITNQSKAVYNLNIYKASDMNIIFDGGNYVRCGGKVIMTDKFIMENPEYPLHQLIEHLHYKLMGDIVLLPWDMTEPYGHADGMVAPLPDGRLLLNNYCQTANGAKKSFYKRLMRILEPNFDLVELSFNCKLKADSWCYLNFLHVPGAVLLPCLSKDFLCDNDLAAIEEFGKLFPDDEIIPIYAEPLIKRGGALHCVTWEYYPYSNRDIVD